MAITKEGVWSRDELHTPCKGHGLAFADGPRTNQEGMPWLSTGYGAGPRTGLGPCCCPNWHQLKEPWSPEWLIQGSKGYEAQICLIVLAVVHDRLAWATAEGPRTSQEGMPWLGS
jgi:hypothetical protein